MQIIKETFIQDVAPNNPNVIWVDTSNIQSPKFKSCINGVWTDFGNLSTEELTTFVNSKIESKQFWHTPASANGISPIQCDNCEPLGIDSVCEGYNTKTGGNDTSNNKSANSELTSGLYAHAEGNSTIAKGANSHAEGRRTFSKGYASHTEGYNTETGGNYSSNTKSAETSEIVGKYAHAEGNATIAKGMDSHSEGRLTFAEGKYSHAEGYQTQAKGSASHAENSTTTAQGKNSHAEGYQTQANGANSHSEGKGTYTQNISEHASGSYNRSNKASTSYGNGGNTIFSIGIGTSDNDRKNAIEVMQNGDVFIKGIGEYDGTNASWAYSIQELIHMIISEGHIGIVMPEDPQEEFGT